MLISHKNQFVFVHIYKTGGTSVTHALIRHARLREQFAERYLLTRAFVNYVNLLFGLTDEGNRWLLGVHKHSTAAELRTALGPNVYDRYFTFAFVRNPWYWQCSQYYYIRASATHRDHRLACRLSFKEFLKYQIETKTRCQLDFLTDTNGNEIVDKIGRYESIQKDFDEIINTLGLPATQLQHLNASKRPREYESCYDSESVALVKRYFARDIERFGYAFPGE